MDPKMIQDEFHNDDQNGYGNWNQNWDCIGDTQSKHHALKPRQLRESHRKNSKLTGFDNVADNLYNVRTLD